MDIRVGNRVLDSELHCFWCGAKTLKPEGSDFCSPECERLFDIMTSKKEEFVNLRKLDEDYQRIRAR